jgi:hypothetical protein
MRRTDIATFTNPLLRTNLELWIARHGRTRINARLALYGP